MHAADHDPLLVVPATTDPVPAGPRPSFSVIVAAWQVADLIGVGVRSVLGQSEPPHELIVVDDGSTDDLSSALVPFGSALRLIRIPHSGLGFARNRSVAAASGDYVAIFDADDRWEPDRLRRLGDLAAARPDVDLLTTDAWFLVNGERRGRFYAANRFPVVDQATEILSRNFFFAHVAVRRTTWQKFGGMSTDLPWAEDWDFWLRLLLGGCRAGCVLEPLADYRIHSGSVSADRFRSLWARVEVLDRAEASGLVSDAQREVLSAARARYRRRALAARAEQRLLSGSRGRRRACLQLLLVAGASPRQRLRAAAAAVAPGWAGSWLRRAAEVRGRARTDRAMPVF